MILVLSIICATIVLCTAIRYGCKVHCQNIEYKIYRELNPTCENPFCVRPYFYKDSKDAKNSFWGYVVFDTDKDEVYTGSGKDNENFIIYRSKSTADEFCREVGKMHGY